MKLDVCAQVVANPFLWAKLQDTARQTPMFDEFVTSTPAASPMPERSATEPQRQRRLTGFARQQLLPSKSAIIAGTAPAGQPAAQQFVHDIQAIAATVLGSTVAAKASFSDAGLDSLGDRPKSHRMCRCPA